jgi:hypothetical protein
MFGKKRKNEIILNKNTKVIDLTKTLNNFSLSSFNKLDFKKSNKCQKK